MVHRICSPNDRTETSSGHALTSTSVLWLQAQQVATSPRTPLWRILPRVIGWIGSPHHRLGSPIGLRAAIAARICEGKTMFDSTPRLEPSNDLRPYPCVGGTPDKHAQMRQAHANFPRVLDDAGILDGHFFD